jgi:hypothetical protein
MEKVKLSTFVDNPDNEMKELEKENKANLVGSSLLNNSSNGGAA